MNIEKVVYVTRSYFLILSYGLRFSADGFYMVGLRLIASPSRWCLRGDNIRRWCDYYLTPYEKIKYDFGESVEEIA